LGRKIFGTLEGKKVLLIGAGEMAELAVEHLMRNRTKDILVANRTFERAVELAGRFRGQPIDFDEVGKYLQHIDIVISSTGAPGFVIHKNDVKKIMRSRRNRPIFFIDIAVPRDIDPELNALNNAYVYDIDDLKGVIAENVEERKKEAVKGERIVAQAVIQFRKWIDSLKVVPTIVALRGKVTGIVEAEKERTLQGLEHLSEDDQQAITRMTEAIVNKILHDPTLFLKNDIHHGKKTDYLNLTKKLFKLDEQE